MSDLSKRSFSRRRFLGEMNCAAVGSTSVLTSLLNLQLTGNLAAEGMNDDEEDYRALVCVFLAGGNDSFNMLAPMSGEARTDYEATRGGVALPVSDFLPLPEALDDGRQLGLHKRMAEVHNLYTSGSAAFVCNVGTLVEPTDLSGIDAGTARLPSGLYSHSDQLAHWQSSTPDQRNPRIGWGGRLADLVQELNGNSEVSMNISAAGRNIFQVGNSSTAFNIGLGGMPQIKEWGNPEFLSRRVAAESLMNQEYASVLERTFASAKKGAVETGESFQEAYLNGTPLTTVFDTYNNYGSQLKAVARTIAARKALSKKRQTFFVMATGWDHHGSLEEHPDMLAGLSEDIGQFYNAMVELGLEDKVTLFTASDFGRTLSPNGGALSANVGGTDHAWGGNQIVVGGGVKKGVYGVYPDLALGNNLDTGRGRLIPTTSVDEYYADLALWMGVSPTHMSYVLPNLHRFHNIIGGEAPLGFME